jgi:hypothetical protein
MRVPYIIVLTVAASRHRVHATAQHAEERGAATKFALERFLSNHVLGAEVQAFSEHVAALDGLAAALSATH